MNGWTNAIQINSPPVNLHYRCAFSDRMRHFVVLFAVYLFSLALLPCADAAPGPVQQVSSELSDQHPADDHPDHCTPLCSCACCSVTTDVPPRLAAWLPAAEPMPPRGVTEPRSVPGWSPVTYVAGSWQPPRA